MEDEDFELDADRDTDRAEAESSWFEDDWASQYDDDPSPYDGTYSEE